MTLFKTILLVLIYTCFAYANFTTEQLINKTHKIQWYMFYSKASKLSYLVNNRDKQDQNQIRVWSFTNDRLWRPISNAKAFNGFMGAANNFKSIKISDDGKFITFGKKSITKNIPIDNYLQDLENKTFEIKWYYWVTENGYPFLATNRGKDSGLSIYQHTKSKKWQPVHNAEAFDSYPAAKATFDEVFMSNDGRYITIQLKKFNIPLIKDILPRDTLLDEFKVTSTEIDDSDFAFNPTIYTTNVSPSLNWQNVPPHTQSLAIEAINLESNKAIWRVININANYKNPKTGIDATSILITQDNNASFLQSGAPTNYKGMTTLENDYDHKKEFYKGDNGASLPKGEYMILIYAVSIKDAKSMVDAKNNAIQHYNLLFKAP